MQLFPELKKIYTAEQQSARQAQRLAEFIAWGPVVFQASRLMVKFGILDLLPSCNTCQRAVGEFVLGGSCFLVTAMEYIIVEGWCQTTGSNLLNGYLIHLCSIVIVGDIRLCINFKY